MEYKILGRTDLKISRMGFGCWAIGGHGYGAVDDNVSMKAVRRALERGINFFDTADVYGFGHSEEVLGEALGADKNSVVIATKFGVNWDKNGSTYIDCSPKRIQESIDGSLKRLKIDCIPLYQVHWYDWVTPIPDILEALEKCRDAGKIRHIGFSNFPLDLILGLPKKYRVESVQSLYNVITNGPEADFEKYAKTLGIGIIVYGVLSRGLFTGKYNPGSRFGKNDTRDKDENFKAANFLKNLQLVDYLREVGAYYGRKPAHVAIRWVLENGNVTSALVGMKTPEQVDENLKAFEFRMSVKDRNSISRFVERMKSKNLEEGELDDYSSVL
ncbi:MAG: aldo/keto reductase [Deltaproteobacteria bacterium]|nr:aldo/keto reductase [Deltaproteobacteria bacterium]